MVVTDYDLNKDKWHIIISFVVSLALCLCFTAIKMPSFMQWFRPEWMFLFIAYWAISENNLLGLSGTFFIGIITDLLLGTVLGMHALIYCILFFVINKVRKVYFNLPMWQQLLFISGICLVAILCQCFILYISNIHVSIPGSLCSWLCTIVLWPFIYRLLTKPKSVSF